MSALPLHWVMPCKNLELKISWKKFLKFPLLTTISAISFFMSQQIPENPQLATHISKLRCDIFFQVKSSCSMGCHTQSFEYDGVQTTVIQMVTKFV